MAVLPFLPGLAVEIVVNGASLPEYDDNSDTPASPTMITKYVEATSGANFTIEVLLMEEFPFPKGHLEAEISLDGRVFMCELIREDQFFNDHLMDGRHSQVGQYPKTQKFFFAKLEITSIQISEKAMKGYTHTHRAGVSKPIARTYQTWWDYDRVTKSPFATFNFKYRSLNALRILGLVPREPTPPPLEERPEDELTPEELRQLVKQLKDRNTASVKIKEEAGVKRKRVDEAIEASDDQGVMVIWTGNRKRHRDADGEIIVLD
ncbi:hypothetical protein J4E85_003144 [Alternaria conjuncta]|uniref:uncharacterized protein n=1 Tax=Alternaria conjuncta TaxID=181017 RepID=UPI002220F39D|nr:uncharacterized protein J4E85_003144 [Alternaria conjuncta]KAI4932744.1 hypothetical protein J4E85_003144 [Alternaria conjuncta]